MTVLDPPDLATLPPPPTPIRGRHWWRGRRSDPPWARLALLALLGGTALLYLWGLGASGWANGFYAAAVQAGSTSWKAMFFGSFDSSNFITVDKPPGALWVMDVSARLFGVNTWSILVPQALEGVATVGLLYATVRRRFSAGAALLAGAAMAVTPIATLMFRFNNPDPLLVLLLVASAYAVVRALESASTRWLALAGVLIGFGFLTKMLQAALVVPGFAGVYLLAAPTSLGRRIRQLLTAGVAMVAAAGWWVLAVALTPVADRPYIGGSAHNSVIELIFGYNGFGRLTGNESGSVGGAPAGGGGSRWGSTGLTRLFGSDMGSQISWLLPAALILLVALLVWSRRRPRTDSGRAQLLIWGSWLLITGLTFSLAQGIIHPYYTVALAPPIAAIVAIGAVELWHRRRQLTARLVLAGADAATAVWSYRLLDRTPSWHPGLRVATLVVGLLTAVVLAVGPTLARRAATALATATVLVALAGPTAYSLDTAATPHTGSIPSAGPTATGFGGAGGPPGPGRGFGGPGGLLETSTPSTALVTALRTNAALYRWVAATIGSNNAAGLQLATGEPVMSIGGFNGTDPTPTLAEFEKLVAAGDIHYFIAGGTGGASSSTSQITAWVQQHYTARTMGGQPAYDLAWSARQ